MAESSLNIIKEEKLVKFEGELTLATIREAEKEIKAASDGDIIDLQGIGRLDSAGALFLASTARNKNIKFINLNTKYKELFDLVSNAEIKPLPKKKEKAHVQLLLEHLGRGAYKAYGSAIEIIGFFGLTCVELVKAISNPWKIRYGAITTHIEKIGINAIPIVALIAFLISIVLAYQGVAQLKPLGAQQFTVNLVALSVLREMGVLLTAIMVAGRSGSAFTAEIGVMKVREEVDALQTIGMDPFKLLVIPRIIALIISLPLLTFIANIMGLLGGAILSLSLLNISLQEYLEQVKRVADFNDYFAGMIKAPIFAITIGVVGCMHGMKVSGSSESVGTETTASVVKSIFIVLLLDAVFSIVFDKLGI